MSKIPENETPDKKPQAATVKAASLTAELADNMPPVSRHAIEAERDQAPGQDCLKDKYGNTFDADIHEADEQGNPKKNWRGLLKMRRGVKKGSSKTSGVNVQDPQEPVSEYRLIALTTVEYIYMTGRFFGGEAAGPKTGIDAETKQVLYDEYKSQLTAWEEFYKHYNMKEVHPIVLVMAATGQYAVRVASTDMGKRRTLTMWEKFKAWTVKILKRKRKGQPERKEPDAADTTIIEMGDIPVDDRPPEPAPEKGNN